MYLFWSKFGTDARKSFGQWFPGRQYFAPVVDQIDPYVTCGYRNVVLMCAINDLKKPEIKNTADIKQNVFIPFIKKIPMKNFQVSKFGFSHT